MPKIYNILSHVYGPYPDNLILGEDFYKSGNDCCLRELRLFNEKPDDQSEDIGFDDSEFIINPGKNSSVNPKNVIFLGILEIDDFKWLSETGRKYLEKDLEEYHDDSHVDHYRSRLTLEKLFTQRREGVHLKVMLRFRKHMLAHFLTSKMYPNDLLLFTKHERRIQTFIVASVHVKTYSMSQNFFERYRLRALIEELVKTDPDRTPVENRDINWLISRYLVSIQPKDSKNHIIVDQKHDITELRHPRHIPRAEIRGYFASHAEWLLANLIAKQHGKVLLDIPQWIKFCRKTRKESIQANSEGVRWGVPRGEEVDPSLTHNLARNLEKYGQTETFWAARLKSAQRPKPKPPKVDQIPLAMDLLLEQRPVGQPAPSHGRFQYDSDFSEPSTPETSDSESNSRNISNVPGFCAIAPEMPSGHFIWNCPGCLYRINLLDLSPEQLHMLPEDTAIVLSGKSWKINDPPVNMAFKEMVSRHYKDEHLTRNNLQLVRSSQSKFCLVSSSVNMYKGCNN